MEAQAFYAEVIDREEKITDADADKIFESLVGAQA